MKVLPALALLVCLHTACSDFADDTRLPAAGTKPTGVTLPDGGPAPTQPGVVSTDGGATPGNDAAVPTTTSCSITAGAASGAGSCGGPGGVDGYPGQTVTAGQVLVRGDLVCGSAPGTLVFTYASTGNACFVVTAQGDGGSVHVTGNETNRQASIAPSTDIAVDELGPIRIEITGASSFKLLVR